MTVVKLDLTGNLDISIIQDWFDTHPTAVVLNVQILGQMAFIFYS